MPAPKKPRSASAKADKPELKPLDEHLAELLNPALNRNRPKPVENRPAEPAPKDPPEPAANGKSVSPISTRTRSGGSPSISPAIWVRIV